MDPPDAFEIVREPSTPLTPGACEVLELSLRFTAPAAPGDVTGGALWRISTTSEEGTAEGTMFLPLFGTSVSAAR